MRSTKDDRQSRIARCVSVIAEFRRSRASDDLESLSDAELIEDLEHVPPRLNRGILMRRRMGESIVIDSLLGTGQCRGLIPETCVSE